MSKADQHYFYGRSILWHTYLLGAVPFFSPRPANSADPEDADCSGFEIGLWWRSKALFKMPDGTWKNYASFFGTSRPTADVIHRHAVRIDQPTQYGDLGFHVDSAGHAYHVFHYAGREGGGLAQRTLESGDGHGIVAMHNVGWENLRHAVWGRVPHDLGALTLPPAVPSLPDWRLPMGQGRVGQDVREAHDILNQVTGSTLTITNTVNGTSYGPKMIAAVKKAEQLYGMKQTGVLSSALVTAIQQHLA